MHPIKCITFKDPEVSETLSTIHDKGVAVTAEKVPNNIVLICKKHYIDCLKTELGLDSSQGNPSYTVTTRSKEKFIDNHILPNNSYKPITKTVWVHTQLCKLQTRGSVG